MAEEPSVTYTVKDLIGRVDVKVDQILSRLETKANTAEVAALAVRVDTLEDELAVERALGRRTARLVIFGVPGFAAFVGTVLGIVFRFVG